ncbi:MAG: glycoside hydrolase family 32 protein [Bacteroidaceae bacterium]|nr:glycoside hydrolase family 32 protein [Bacteroidaceae bacterium]
MRRFALFAFLLVAVCGAEAAEITLKVKARYLNLPISHRTERRRLTFQAKGVDDLSVVVRLAEGKPDYWVFKDLSAYRGRQLRLTYDGSEEALRRLVFADSIMGESRMYREDYRPQFHFTTRRGWINDPNGLVFADGEYHLFYQHNPFEREWENMHWGHAVSRDLLHWQEYDDVLLPDSLGTMFSGSAVMDVRNTSGFGRRGVAPMVVAYTNDGKHQTQCIAYSLDGGRTMQKYNGGRPVIDSNEKWQTHDTRDPRLLWYEPARHWVMALNERDGNSIYTSDNLRDWTYRSHVTGFWECPDLFELPIDGNPAQTCWVMSGASGTYMLGDFDGQTFTPRAGKYCYTTGTIYAAQTFNGMADGRRVQIGWGRVSHPGMPFRGMMLLPTELTLRTTPDGVRLFSQPVRELRSLMHRRYSSDGRQLSQTEADTALQTFGAADEGLHLHFVLTLSHSTGAGLELNGQRIVDYDLNHNTLSGRFFSPADPTSMSLSVDIYIDRTSVEVFVEDGMYSYSLERRCDANRSGFRFFGNRISVSDLCVDSIDSIF